MQLDVMDYLLLERVSRNLAQVNKLLSAYTISSLSQFSLISSGLSLSNHLQRSS